MSSQRYVRDKNSKVCQNRNLTKSTTSRVQGLQSVSESYYKSCPSKEKTKKRGYASTE